MTARHRHGMELTRARTVLDDQSGVVARRQLLDLGAAPHDLRRWLRRRELVQVHPGVYLNHTGPLTWSSRAWAATLHFAPSALSHQSAVNLAGDVVHVAVADGRTLEQRPGVRLHWLTGFEDRVLWGTSPPRVRFEDALLSLCAAAPTRTSALTIAADACRRRRTTPERLLRELETRPRLRHRAWLRDVLLETATGVQSALESGYLRRVERAHGLPRGTRQVRNVSSRGTVYRDVLYAVHGVAIELDGRVGHELSEERWSDMDRDLEAAADGLLTLRVGWRQTEDEPCVTAARVGSVLAGRGWTGHARPCGAACSLVDALRIGATG
jgi:hypothetical protein